MSLLKDFVKIYTCAFDKCNCALSRNNNKRKEKKEKDVRCDLTRRTRVRENLHVNQTGSWELDLFYFYVTLFYSCNKPKTEQSM
jgi:hypothetical protein